MLATAELANADGATLLTALAGTLSNWKGLAAPFAASAATQGALLAQYGITGPSEVFEGNKGYMQSITGPFAIDWAREGLGSRRGDDHQATQR